MRGLLVFVFFLSLSVLIDLYSAAPVPLIGYWDVDKELPLKLKVEHPGQDDDYGVLPHYPKFNPALMRKELDQEARKRKMKGTKANVEKSGKSVV